MIKIEFDKESEWIWLKNIVEAGVLNTNQKYTMNFLGVPFKQNVTYVASNDYEDDIKEKREEYNRRFANKGLRGMDIERILKEEYNQSELN